MNQVMLADGGIPSW